MLKIKRALAFTLLSLAVLPVATSSAAVGDPVLDVEERAFCTQINEYRVANGRAPLQVSVSLTNAAKWMSNDMATKNRFGHTDSLGRTFGVRLNAFNYGFPTYRGENIAAGHATAAATFAQWRASAGHNANMLNANYRVIGIGRAYSATSTYRNYWTTDFGGHVDGTIPC